MKKLLLLRHAKSAWGDASMPDVARPLNQRGARAATLVGTWMAQQGLVPDLVLCSAALRTRQTWEHLSEQIQADPEVRVEQALYLADAATILEHLVQVEDRFGSVLVLGHNPGLSDLAHGLSGDGDPGALERLDQGMPTAGLAEIDVLRERWADLEPAAGRLSRLVRPKELV